ncbi:ABC transporter ATP-binding protein [Paenibacillus larvae subsp. pulvifaciens]|uniref:ABC transporter ATP-binding protein n=1 Tax=Paenibacillus larvae subsp. pulvifaciens TaxID=1477 RepID=A0A1V0UP57_9BACL|nr:ABC transporter ATP-binding protein [Paenibacillus larvae]ARF66954.1 ABC transporter ATP-binding protein [Paenibacillus larvae subsp. pulvifaciens]
MEQQKQPEVVLSVDNVTKIIRGKKIIKVISFEVYAGEIFGFLGPNGAGKTTTIRMLVDLITPSSGSIRVCGYDVHRQHNEAMAQIGCIVENPELYGYLTGWENLEHSARMLPGITEKRIGEVVDIVGMDARIHDKVKTYSLGMRQRLGIAQALLGNPKLLILDEPTNGLDPQGIKEMREFIQNLAKTGLSLFVSSHLLSEIQQMCNRVAIISKGSVIQVGGVEELLGQASHHVVWTLSPKDKALSILQQEEGIHILHQEPYFFEAKDQSDVSRETIKIITEMEECLVSKLNVKLVQNGVQVWAIEIKTPTLEELFLGLTEGEKIG